MFKFSSIGKKIRSLFSSSINEETLENLERLFYEADLGPEISAELTNKVRTLMKKDAKQSVDSLLETIRLDLVNHLKNVSPPPPLSPLHVILIEGVNGNGKTTSVAKLAFHYQKQGRKVLVSAADTFRAAAMEQLERWISPLGIPLVKGNPKSDPAAVVFDSITAAKNRGCDLVIIDTAGRLHTKTDLMQELGKICRVTGKALPGAPHETLLVLDATIGQNGVEQAKIFHQFTPLTGLILTKLDGSAKGGTALAIQRTLQLPIRFIGTGKKLMT